MGRRHVRIDLAYDGTEFHGWQAQPAQRTVQGTLEAALGRIEGDRPVRVRGAGRTDAGVHARGQVADCELATGLSEPEVERALAGMLPPDLRALQVLRVAPEFHARRDAVSKSYRYRLDRSVHGDPFRRRFTLHHPHAIDRAALDAALALLPGKRDWSGFTAAHCEVENRVRTVTEARFEETGPDEAALVFSADGFLTHMARNLVGTLLDIASGRTPVERVAEVLESRDRTRAGPTAAARGLCLERVVYGG